MKTRISIILSGSSTSGLGHISRMSSLISEFKSQYEFNAVVLDDSKKSANQFLSIEPKHMKSSALESFLLDKKPSNHLIFDVSEMDLGKLSFILKNTYPNELRIAALDYFGTNHAIDIIFNLFNQNNKSFRSETNNTKVGLEYAIINPILKKIKKIELNKRKTVLVRLSSKIPEIYLKILQSEEVKQIIYKQNLSFDENYEVSKDEFMDKLVKSRLYIGGGATTALECLFLGNAVIFFPSNKNELNFGMALSSCSSNFYTLDTAVHSQKYFGSLLEELLAGTSENMLRNSYNIDGLGASRILRGLLENE
jgi:spore coat polysaccharide biosynthesis predicted glycosyltransferase SpsG